MIVAQVLFAAAALFARACSEEVNVADAIFNLETRQAVVPACNTSFVDGLYLPSQDPNVATRNALLGMIGPTFLHTTRVPGLPLAIGGPSGIGWAEADYTQFMAINLAFEQQNAGLKVQTFFGFMQAGVTSFTTIASMKQAYALLPPAQSLNYDTTTDSYFGHSRQSFAAHYIIAVKALPFTLTSAQTAEVTKLLDNYDTLTNALANGKIFVEDHSSFNWTLPYVIPGRHIGYPT
ncbi:hypothetical protein HDU76_011982, partial [Blyttiomyces sp. JEL0837]